MAYLALNIVPSQGSSIPVWRKTVRSHFGSRQLRSRNGDGPPTIYVYVVICSSHGAGRCALVPVHGYGMEVLLSPSPRPCSQLEEEEKREEVFPFRRQPHSQPELAFSP